MVARAHSHRAQGSCRGAAGRPPGHRTAKVRRRQRCGASPSRRRNRAVAGTVLVGSSSGRRDHRDAEAYRRADVIPSWSHPGIHGTDYDTVGFTPPAELRRHRRRVTYRTHVETTTARHRLRRSGHTTAAQPPPSGSRRPSHQPTSRSHAERRPTARRGDHHDDRRVRHHGIDVANQSFATRGRPIGPVTIVETTTIPHRLALGQRATPARQFADDGRRVSAAGRRCDRVIIASRRAASGVGDPMSFHYVSPLPSCRRGQPAAEPPACGRLIARIQSKAAGVSTRRLRPAGAVPHQRSGCGVRRSPGIAEFSSSPTVNRVCWSPMLRAKA